ncbi:MAG: carbonic anhydrase [Planctomycetota bacterium]
MKHSLLSVQDSGDVLPRYRGTPIDTLLTYHNLGETHGVHKRTELLIGMCMDHRIRLRILSNFAYVLRTGGANLRPLEFQVSFAIAVKGVRVLCLIGHGDCGMVGLASKRDVLVRGLIENAGWEQHQAEDYFDQHASRSEVGNALEFVCSEAQRLRKRYPGIMVAPLFYGVEDGRLYQIDEGSEVR